MTLGNIGVGRKPSPTLRALARLRRIATSPACLLLAFAIAVLLGLALPLSLPLGPNYWDTNIYLDAARRIELGQLPNIDFFAPVGPLHYYLATGLHLLFPLAQPALLANWSVLPIALPLLAVIVAHVDRRSRAQALALLLPFLLFASLPINLHSLYPMPGLDGYGHYNRHISLLLYLLVSALLFVDSRGLRAGLVVALMLALFLVKVTGAVTGAFLVGYAVLAGRIGLREASLAAALVLAVLVPLDIATGIVRAYVDDILTLLGMNRSALLPRFLTVASVKFNVIGPALLLLAALACDAWRDRRGVSLARLREILASPLGWLAAALSGLTLFETQNTGSLEFIGLWPVLLLILLGWRARSDRLGRIVMVLALAVALPSAVIFVERSARAILGAASYRALDLADLGPLGRVSVKPDIAQRAEVMLAHYAAQQAGYRELAERGVLPSYILYSEIDYQASWLLEVAQGVAALRAWESASGRRLDSLFTLDFTDPFNHLLDRRPPKHVPIGVDPGRSTPEIDPMTLASLNQVDAILAPKCPLTTARSSIAAHFSEALKGRKHIALAPCWDMYLKE